MPTDSLANHRTDSTDLQASGDSSGLLEGSPRKRKQIVQNDSLPSFTSGGEAASLQGLVCGQRVSVVCAESRESHLGYLLPHTALHAAQPADGQPERFAVLYAHGGCEPVVDAHRVRILQGATGLTHVKPLLLSVFHQVLAPSSEEDDEWWREWGAAVRGARRLGAVWELGWRAARRVDLAAFQGLSPRRPPRAPGRPKIDVAEILVDMFHFAEAWQEEKETYKNMCGQLIELKWDDNQWYSGFLVPRVLLDEEHARMPDMEYGVLYEDGDSDLFLAHNIPREMKIRPNPMPLEALRKAVVCLFDQVLIPHDQWWDLWKERLVACTQLDEIWAGAWEALEKGSEHVPAFKELSYHKPEDVGGEAGALVDVFRISQAWVKDRDEILGKLDVLEQEQVEVQEEPPAADVSKNPRSKSKSRSKAATKACAEPPAAAVAALPRRARRDLGVSVIDNRFEVKQCKEKFLGRGVFASRVIPKGSFLFHYDGTYVKGPIDWDNMKHPEAALEYMYELSNGECVDGITSPGYAKFVNHYKGVADMPNVAPREVFGDRGGHFGEGLMVEMTAMSDIQPGEQLLFDYGPHYRDFCFKSAEAARRKARKTHQGSKNLVEGLMPCQHSSCTSKAMLGEGGLMLFCTKHAQPTICQRTGCNEKSMTKHHIYCIAHCWETQVSTKGDAKPIEIASHASNSLCDSSGTSSSHEEDDVSDFYASASSSPSNSSMCDEKPAAKSRSKAGRVAVNLATGARNTLQSSAANSY